MGAGNHVSIVKLYTQNNGEASAIQVAFERRFKTMKTLLTRAERRWWQRMMKSLDAKDKHCASQGFNDSTLGNVFLWALSDATHVMNT